MGEKEASTTLILVSLNPLVPFREDRGRGKEVWFDRGSQNHKFGKRTPAQSSASYPSYYEDPTGGIETLTCQTRSFVYDDD
ncbi:hypothetical protein MUK42_07823 [Musa troglodytarum]|uniref:Uncharacterized protein n=1 Tax=Musa troglodytarum TaxID=320322 RepID=A0A9E7FKC5_9LILI|nr:hypothetical protein MUK42_07823 [Musa troglodytarum]